MLASTRLQIGQAQLISSFAIVGLCISLIFSSPFLNAAILISTILGISLLMPSENCNLRIVLAYGYLSTGMVLYLVVRGFVINTPISRYDFLLSLLSLVMISVIQRYITRRKDDFFIRNLSKSALAGASAFFVCIGLSIFTLTKGLGYFLAWSASGDSRNHVQAIYSLANQGSIAPESLGFPQLATSISTFLNSGMSTYLGENSKERMIGDLASHSLTWLLLISLLGFAFASIWESALDQKASLIRTSVLVPASLFAVSSMSLGTNLRGGFVSAAAASISVALAIALLFDRTFKTGGEYVFVFGTLILLAVFSWTLSAVAVVLLSIPLIGGWIDFRSKTRLAYMKLSLVILVVFLGAIAYEKSFDAKLTDVVNLSGSIIAVDPRFYSMSIVILLILSVLSRSFSSSLASNIFFIAFAASASILWLKGVSEIAIDDWNYYTLKMMMVILIGILPAIFLFIPLAISQLDSYHSISRLRLLVSNSLITVLIFMGTEFISPIPKVLTSISNGWVKPDPSTLETVFDQDNDPKNPTVLFSWNPADPDIARMGNFWLGAYAKPLGPFQAWSNIQNPEDDIVTFCTLNKEYPSMTVVTRNQNLDELMKETCPNEKVKFVYVGTE